MSSKTELTKSLTIEGMHCASCASTIQRRLLKVAGVASCVVNYGTEKATVVFDSNKTSVAAMNHEIGRLGYALVDAEDNRLTIDHEHKQSLRNEQTVEKPMVSEASVKDTKLRELTNLRRNLVIIMPGMLISILVMVWEVGADPLGWWPQMPNVAMDFFHHLLPVIATYVLFVIGRPYLQALVRFAQFRVANMDTLVGLGTFVAFLYSFILSAFSDPLAPFLNTQQSYYDVTIVVIGFISLGKYLETRSKLQTGEAIEKLLHLQAKTATVLRNGEQVEVSIDEVMVGDVIVIKPGQKVPVDGKIIEGASSLDESMITGESIPVDKVVGDLVIGATINKQGSLKIEATQVGEDTVLSQIIKMVEAAQGSKAPIERLADTISSVFVPVVLLFAVVMLLVWVAVGSQFMVLSEAITLGIVSFVGILVIACPCAMGLATPTAVIVGVGKAAQHGVLIKNAESLEKCHNINCVVFDKTGTLTKGTPALTDIQTIGQRSETEVVQLLASLENLSEHPLARAIVDRALAQNLELYDVSNFSVLEGKGLKGVIKTTQYYAGNLKLASDLKIDVDRSVIQKLSAQGKTAIVLFSQDQVLAYFGIADTIKEEAQDVVTALHSMGIKVVLLTGDNQQTAEYIAKQAGIDQVIAEVLPADKAGEVAKLQQQGYKVAMVGDGINDAPALVTADVGIAMGSGTDVAIESAGITLLGGRISKLPKALLLAKATMTTVKQNLFWAFFYNVVGIPIAAGLLYPFWGILLNPAIAGAAMAFSSVSVVLNALRLKTVKL